ncbi:MAG: hypothetical protein AAF684_00815 [Pseudomonadota bacterium]
MIDWRARYPEPNPRWGPDLTDKVEALRRAERALAGSADYATERFRRQQHVRQRIQIAMLQAAETAGEYLALRLQAEDFDRRAARRGVGLREIERVLPRSLNWGGAPALAEQVLRLLR